MAETVLEKIKRKLAKFVENGGDVNSLGRNDELYRYILFSNIVDERGDRLGLEAKFELAGYPRKSKRAKSAKEILKEEAQAWLDAGNSFHVARKSLPFFERLHTVVKYEKIKQNRDVSYEEIMKSLGFKNYSDTYYRYSKLMSLADYKDEDGLVDGYRRDSKMKGFVNSCAESLDMPIAVVVGLIANQNMKKYYLDVDYFKRVRDDLKSYINQHGSLVDLKRNNSRLYGRLEMIKERIGLGGDSITMKQVLELLDIVAENNFFSKSKKNPNNREFENIMFKLIQTAKQKNGVLRRADIEDGDYLKILGKAVEFGCYMPAFFRLYDINYVDGKENKRFKKMEVEEYPYLSEMRHMRDGLYANALQNNTSLCKEEKFEMYMGACKQAYNKYKGLIHNFKMSDSSEPDDEGLE